MNETISYIGLLSDEEIELDSAALALSELDHDGVDLEPYLDRLRAISEAVEAAKVRAGDDDLRSGMAQGALLAAVIGRDWGFTGDQATYDAPLNADMIRVLDRKRGLPVSLSILYVAAARRVGWAAHPLDTPGHVLVRVGKGAESALIDPFNGGAPVEPAQLDALIARALGPEALGDRKQVAPMSNRMTLVRLLLNQASRAEQAGDTSRACVIYERMTMVAPEHGPGWWQLARLQLMHRNIDAARASLTAMLEITRDPERRGQISKMLTSIAGKISY
ncbi:MAG: transglutaminase-like domain-containing protein [Sphingobium sp.]